MLKNYTPLALWKDFDPMQAPLDTHLVKSYEVDGITISVYTFCGHQLLKQSSRVLAYVATKPHKTKQPAILVIDPTNRVNTATLSEWAKLGYTAIGIDYLGESEEHQGLMTIYPTALSFADYNNAKYALKKVDEDAQKTCWYEWTLSTRRAVTFAQSLEGVNGDKIGLYSLREGNIIALQTLAMDDRVKAGAVLYGNLWEYIDTTDATPSPNDTSEQLAKKMEQGRSNDEWLAAISPQSYLKYIKQPFYTCVGTNSPNTDMDKTYECLLRMGNNREGAVLFAPRMMDSLPSNYTSNLQRWFALQLAEQKNSLKMQDVNVNLSAVCRDGNIFIEASATDLPNYAKASLYYSRNRAGTESTRNWIEVSMTKTEDLISAPLKIFSTDTPIIAFCNLTFRNGVNVSSNLLKFVPSKQFSDKLNVERRSPLLFNGIQGTAEFTTMNTYGTQTTEFIDAHPVSCTVGAHGISGVCGTNMGSFVLCDDKITYQESSLLLLDAYSREEQQLDVYLIYDWGGHNHSAFKHSVKLSGGDVWQKITLSANDFKDIQSGKPATLRDIRAICFVSQREVILNNILFT